MEIKEFIRVGEAEGWLRATDNVNMIRISGQNQDQRVFEVRIDKLHYNVQNGRIATFVSRYQMEHGALPADVEELDSLIERMIEDDNPKRLKTTKLDIKVKGQQEVAIILSNGIVIDGNRRFTCLRMLSREEATPRFLRCYIFPDSYDEKAIKGLELEIQLGRDEKVDYDPISRLVDINTWVNGGKMSAEEYGAHANISKSDMKKFLRQIDVLNDFLEFINAPGAYHIAQDLKLQGIIESLVPRLQKCKSEDDRQDMESVVFANVLMGNAGDRVRAIRDMCDYIDASQKGDGEYIDEQMEIVEQVLEKLEDMPADTAVSTEFIRDHIANDDDLKNEQKASNEKARTKAGNSKIKNGQVRSVQDSLSSLEGVDVALLSKLSPEQLDDMGEGLQRVIELAARLKVQVENIQRDA